MAKIKFNLNFGGEQIRTLDDLRDNFSIEDVLDVYNNGLLVKWLDVHNHKNELEQVNAIRATDARGILSELIRILGVTSDPSEIEESLSVLDYLEERKKFWADIKAGKFDEISRNITKSQNEEETHHASRNHASRKSYDDLVQEIIDNHMDLYHIYDCLDVITADYPDILRDKHSELFETLHTQRPLTLYALFAHHGTRPYFVLNDDEIKVEPDTDNSGHYNTRCVRLLYPPQIGYEYGTKIRNKDYTWIVSTNSTSPSPIPAVESEILPSVSEKLHFINALKVVSTRNFMSVEDGYKMRDLLDIKHPFLKFWGGIKYHNYSSDIDEIWHVVESPERNFIIFATPSMTLNTFSAYGLVANTYSHHLHLRLHHCLELTFPILEGIDAKTEKYHDWYLCTPFYYMEAR